MSDRAGFGIAPPGYRLPPATAVGAVRLQVSDLDRSLAYYTRVIGLRLIGRDSVTAALGPHDDSRVLVRLEGRSGLRPVPRRGVLGLYHFAILLPDRPALGRFVAHLHATGVAAGSSDHFVSESLYLTDPDGLGIEVYADRPRSTWRVQPDGQLFMTIATLDIPGLRQAAAGQSWSGVPAGTVMGHIHLHVGDLDEGARFYHAALGFDRVAWSYPGALFLSAGGYHHHLGTNTWASGPPAADDQPRLQSWDLVLPSAADAGAVAASLTAAGYAATRDDDAWVAADPWGTRLRLVAGASA
jgi:catechol 2,3-dioxygenase